MSRTTPRIVHEDIELCIDLIVERCVPARATVVAKQRVDSAMLAMELVPWKQAAACKRAIVVVSEIVVLVSRPNPQMGSQKMACHNDSRRKEESTSGINGPPKKVRGKQNASSFQRIVPIAIGKVVASWSPAVACRYPEPVRIAD